MKHALMKSSSATRLLNWLDQLPFTLAMGLLLVSTGRYDGHIAMMAAPFIAIWLVYSAVVALRRPARRRGQAVKLAILLLVLCTISTAHWWHTREARAHAQDFADAVLAYQARVGHFPKRAAEAGVDEERSRQQWKLIYSMHSNEPELMYRSTFNPYDIFQFDFNSRTWIRHRAGSAAG